jgi:hypothetical protein
MTEEIETFHPMFEYRLMTLQTLSALKASQSLTPLKSKQLLLQPLIEMKEIAHFACILFQSFVLVLGVINKSILRLESVRRSENRFE